MRGGTAGFPNKTAALRRLLSGCAVINDKVSCTVCEDRYRAETYCPMPDKNDNGHNTTARENCYNGQELDKLWVQALAHLKHRRGPRQHQMLQAGTTNHHCGDDSRDDNRGNHGGRANDEDQHNARGFPANGEGQHGAHANFYCGDVYDHERQ